MDRSEPLTLGNLDDSGYSAAAMVGVPRSARLWFPGPMVGMWSVLCGALATGQFRPAGEPFLRLAMTLLLVNLAWLSLWHVMTGSDWLRSLASGWPPVRAARLPLLPFTHPLSPAGRLSRWLSRVLGWWQETAWPLGGRAIWGIVLASGLAVVLTMQLPARLLWLNAAPVALIVLGVIQRRTGRAPLAAQALVQVGLGWLAGHMAFADLTTAILSLAFLFSAAAWGLMRVAEGRRAGMWLLVAAQGLVAAGLVGLERPLAAGVLGVTILGAIALHLAVRQGLAPDSAARRSWPWLLAAMLVAGWGLS